MPTRRIDYVDQPLALRRYTPNYGPMAALYSRTGELLADISLQRGQTQGRTMATLAGLFSNFSEGGRREKAAELERAIRATERGEDRIERKAERDAAEAERKAARDDRKNEADRGAARYAVDNATPGPQSPALAALAARFPETATRFRAQEPLPATALPGTAPLEAGGSSYPVLEPTAEQSERAGTLQRQYEALRSAEARAKRDDDRADQQLRQTGAYQDASLEIARQNAASTALNAQTNQSRYTTSGVDTAAMPTALSNALERSILMITANKRKPIIQQANRLAAAGNLNEVKGIIKQAAIEGENVDTKNQIRGRIATMAALADARTVLGEMKAAGVPSNWFTGTVEDLARKVGTSTDPRYVAFKNQLADALIAYRRAATGVAFSEREARDYAQMFPNYKQTMPVNEAAITGLERAMRTNDRAYWETKLGPEGAAMVIGEAAPAAKPTILSIVPVPKTKP